MSEMKSKLKNALTSAMKAREAARLQTLRMAVSAIQKKEIDSGKDLTDPECEKVLQTMIKQLQETIEQAKSLGRSETVTANEIEIVVLREFLPQNLTEIEVQKIVEGIVAELKAAGTLAPGGAGLGMAMKAAMAKVGSRSDGKIVQNSVKKALGLPV